MRLLTLMLAAAVMLLPCPSAATEYVTFPQALTYTAPRLQYCFILLEKALASHGGRYKARLSTLPMHQGRALLLLERNEGIDVTCYMTSAEREERLLPIRIPVDKGLIGWRLLLIHKSQADRFARYSSGDDLRPLTAAQGNDWPDTEILRLNGFKVHSTSNFEGMFKMLIKQQLDYFPRAVSEIWVEADANAPRLIVAPGLALRYNTAAYFFVRKGNTALAAALAEGLDKMIADGSFEKEFEAYYGAAILRARLKSRKIIELHNPLLPNGIPRERRNMLLFSRD
ncbi:MAG: hypothetical protein V4633_17610 [Pseudomonadota bacterium]